MEIGVIFRALAFVSFIFILADTIRQIRRDRIEQEIRRLRNRLKLLRSDLAKDIISGREPEGSTGYVRLRGKVQIILFMLEPEQLSTTSLEKVKTHAREMILDDLESIQIHERISPIIMARFNTLLHYLS